jgi:hypothetical protein
LGFDVGLIGFPEFDIAACTENTVRLTDPDEAPDVPANVVSIP